MLKIHIQSLGDSGRDFSLEVEAEKLPKLFDEFFGSVVVDGHVKVHSDRFSITGKAKGKAKLECDLSLKEYEEEIEAEFQLTARRGLIEESEEDNDTIYISDDDTYIDISEIVGETLSLAIPMKRIAPEFRDKELKDIHPDRAEESEENNSPGKDTWAALKKIKLN